MIGLEWYIKKENFYQILRNFLKKFIIIITENKIFELKHSKFNNYIIIRSFTFPKWLMGNWNTYAY